MAKFIATLCGISSIGTMIRFTGEGKLPVAFTVVVCVLVTAAVVGTWVVSSLSRDEE
jgi:hypothetical protein